MSATLRSLLVALWLVGAAWSESDNVVGSWSGQDEEVGVVAKTSLDLNEDGSFLLVISIGFSGVEGGDFWDGFLGDLAGEGEEPLVELEQIIGEVSLLSTSMSGVYVVQDRAVSFEIDEVSMQLESEKGQWDIFELLAAVVLMELAFAFDETVEPDAKLETAIDEATLPLARVIQLVATQAIREDAELGGMAEIDGDTIVMWDGLVLYREQGLSTAVRAIGWGELKEGIRL